MPQSLKCSLPPWCRGNHPPPLLLSPAEPSPSSTTLPNQNLEGNRGGKKESIHCYRCSQLEHSQALRPPPRATRDSGSSRQGRGKNGRGWDLLLLLQCILPILVGRQGRSRGRGAHSPSQISGSVHGYQMVL